MSNQTKKLHRSKSERVIAGVAGGLGKYFGIDPVLFRILFVFLVLWGGAGAFFYLVLMFIIPREDGQSAQEVVKEAADNIKDKTQEMVGQIKQETQDIQQQSWWKNRRHVLGVVVILSGLMFLLNQLFPIKFLKFNFVWPVVVVLIGVFVILKKK